MMMMMIGDDGGGGEGLQGASMVLGYEAVTVYYFNTTSNAEVALYRFPINDSDYTRTRVCVSPSPSCVVSCRVVSCRASVRMPQVWATGQLDE